MYNSQYYTCEQIDERLLQGYLDDYNSQTGQSLTKAQFLIKLRDAIDTFINEWGVRDLIEGYIYNGFLYGGYATPTGTPQLPSRDINASPMFFIATSPGTYTNYGNVVIVKAGLHIILWDTDTWSLNQNILEIEQEFGNSTLKLISQKIITDGLQHLGEGVNLLTNILATEVSDNSLITPSAYKKGKIYKVDLGDQDPNFSGFVEGYQYYIAKVDGAAGDSLEDTSKFEITYSSSEALNKVIGYIKTDNDNIHTQVGYYECDTAAGTAAKVLSVASYALFVGGSMKVKFANKNTANNATLNINSQGAKALYYQGERASATNSWDDNEVVEIYYDGTSYYANNIKGGSGSGVYDVSKEHPTSGPNGDGKFTLEYILNSSNVNELIPVNKREPGMTIQFVSTSDNKYVQYMLTATAWSTNVSDWTEGGGGNGVYDISATHSNATYDNLTAALGTNGANVPTVNRKGGMRVQFIQNIYATYRVVKTDGLNTEPTGTHITGDVNPNVNTDTYVASQLTALSTEAALPTTINGTVTYYIAITETVDEVAVTTYTKWVVTKLTADATKYVQFRYLLQYENNTAGNVAFVNASNWQGTTDDINANNTDLIESKALQPLVPLAGNDGKPIVVVPATFRDHTRYWGRYESNMNAYCVADIDVHEYVGRTINVVNPGNVGIPIIYFVKADNTTAVSNAYERTTVPTNAYYARVNLLMANKSSFAIIIEPIPNVLVASDRLNIEESLNPENVWCIGTSFLETMGRQVSSQIDHGFQIPPKRYNRMKYRLAGSGSTTNIILNYYIYIDAIGMYCRMSFNVTNVILDGHVHEVPIDLDLSISSKNVYIQCLSTMYKSGNHQNGEGGTILAYDVMRLTGKTNDNNLTKVRGEISIDFAYVDEDVKFKHNGIYNDYFSGKRYVAYGDSITDFEANSWASLYPAHIARHFGLQLIEKGEAGLKPTSNLTDNNLSVIDTDTMLVTISGGRNGWATSADINTLDRSTDVGAINYAIDYIRSVQPKCVIVLCPTYTDEWHPQVSIDYARIAENKHVGLAPTTDLRLIDWVADLTTRMLTYDGTHFTAYGGTRFASVCISYLQNYMMI